MGQEPDQLRAEIEQTRAELDRDVDALTEKVNPSRVVGRRVDRTKEAAVGVKDRVMGRVDQVKDSAGDASNGAGDTARSAVSTVADRAEGNPIAAGVIAFGVGWLVSSLLPASKAEERAGAKVRDLASEHADTVKEQVKSVATQVGDELKEPAKEAAQAVQDRAKDSGQRVAGEARAQAPAGNGSSL